VTSSVAISLQKGQRIDLTKSNPGLTKVMIGLGWDPVSQSSGKGLLGGLFGGSSAANVDCDASVIMLKNDKFADKKDLIYFGNLKSNCKSVIHSGDNLTGDGDGDDEQVQVELTQIPQDVNKLVFVVNIYDCTRRKQDFGMIQNAFIRVVNQQNNQELVRFNLTDNYSGQTTLITGELYRHGTEWKFAAIGEGTTDPGLQQIVQRYI
jgi:stress response protein SCP2